MEGDFLETMHQWTQTNNASSSVDEICVCIVAVETVRGWRAYWNAFRADRPSTVRRDTDEEERFYHRMEDAYSERTKRFGHKLPKEVAIAWFPQSAAEQGEDRYGR